MMDDYLKITGKIDFTDWGFVENEPDGKRIAKIMREALQDTFRHGDVFALLDSTKRIPIRIELCLPFHPSKDFVIAIDFEKLVLHHMWWFDDGDEKELARFVGKLRSLADRVETEVKQYQAGCDAEIEASDRIEEQISKDPFRPVSDPYWLTHNPGPGPDRPELEKPKDKATDT